MSVLEKVRAIFSELAGEESRHLHGVSSRTVAAITRALTPQYGAETAGEVGFHMADWNEDAAFMVALHLFPERFSDEEIAAGIQMFLVHAPSHIRAACKLTDESNWTELYE